MSSPTLLGPTLTDNQEQLIYQCKDNISIIYILSCPKRWDSFDPASLVTTRVRERMKEALFECAPPAPPHSRSAAVAEIIYLCVIHVMFYL
mmetsp:Transcript_13391/g.22268  ORF Transcript_13391/g.22268 Transcript_13391/m.22268 type:complete len:91 (-) Transcript_13391:82-354(-)